MSEKFMIDTSALLTVLYKETSNHNLDKYFRNSVMHAVNISEALAVLHRDGMPIKVAEDIIKSTITEIIYGDFQEASEAAQIRCNYKQYGISTGDSFCLATAIARNYTVVTADKIWTKLDLGIEIILVR